MYSILKKLLGIKRKYRIWKHHHKIKELEKNGLTIGKNVWIMSGVQIDNIYPFLVSIGNNCCISHGVQILAHDGTTFKFNGGYERIGRVVIKDNCFIGTNSIILPGVTIGPNVMVAAGSVVNKDIAPNSCIAGVPARYYRKFDEMIEMHKEIIKNGKFLDYNDLKFPADQETKEKICNNMVDDQMFIFIGNRNNPYKIS